MATNAIGHTARLARQVADPASLAATLKDRHALLERLVNELQRSVLGIRVLPLRHVFRHFPASSVKWPSNWANPSAC